MAIQVLPQRLINQIAAGEVVVNMASVVKELVENALDAGAVNVSVDLSGDLRDAVITDDGCGMDRDDAELSLQRHATSKIRTTEDLFNISTRGFRGEAVPSIASVSRMEIITRPHDEMSGTRIVVEGGAIETVEPAGCAPGTRFAVRDLFYNTPARRKFLKSPLSEMNTIMRTVVRQALAAPRVGFRITREGDVRLELPPGQSLEDRFHSLMGSRVEHGLLAVDGARDEMTVYGYVAAPQSTQGDRRSEYLFVNGRPFASKAIASAIEQAGKGFVMIGRFPIFCLFIEAPPEEVDVNVHPTKEEVRFRDERAVAGMCYRAVKAAFEKGTTAVDGHLGSGHLDGQGDSPRPPGTTPPAGDDAPGTPAAPAVHQQDFLQSPEALVARAFEKKRARAIQTDWLGAQQSMETFQPQSPEFAPALSPPAPGGSLPPLDPAHISAGPGEKPDPDFWSRGYDPEPLGQIALTYILVRYGSDLLIVDQHAAHERIRYMELRGRPREAATQTLLTPYTFDPPTERRAALDAMIPALREAGFEVEPFGGGSYAVNAVPADLDGVQAPAVIRDLLEEMDDAEEVRALDDLRDRILVRAACHSSIRAGQSLGMAEMRELLELMQAHQLSFTCPHGRPTIVRLSKDELDKQFKRVV